MKRTMFSSTGRMAAALAAISFSLMAGCAAPDTVTPRFPKLEESINAAKDAEAAVYAASILESAESKYKSAVEAVASGDMVLASRLVDEAMADADYAQVKAPTEKAKQAAQNLQDAIKALREEIRKISGES